MKAGKVSGLIHALEPAEIPLFRNRLESGSGGTDKKLKILFDELNYALKKEENDPDKKLLFKKCFPHEKFSDQKFRYLMSDLVLRLENFISRRGFEKDEKLFHQVLTRELASRHAVKAYNRHRLDYEEKKSNSVLRDAP